MSDYLVKRLRDLASLEARAMPPAWQGQHDLYSASADRIEELEAKLAKAVEALLWCSGSADFNEGGVARKGWLKVCEPIIFAELTGETK